jgi:hypothetical protein
MNDTVTDARHHDSIRREDQPDSSRLLLESCRGRLEVEWDTGAKVTPMGSLVYFAQFLNTGGLMDRLCQDVPLVYTSPNAPKPRDILGTLVLSILHGQTRYAHINALRGDRVSADLLGISKVVSEDSVRRALKRSSAEAWDSWLSTQEVKRTAEQLSIEAVWAIILSAAFIKWLRGKVLHPISEQDQIMLRLA